LQQPRVPSVTARFCTVFLAILLAATVDAAEGKRSTIQPSFVTWVERVARAEGLRVTRFAEGQLDDQSSVERAALLCDPGVSTRAFWLIEVSAGNRWVLTEESTQPFDCREAPPAVEALNGSLTISERMGATLVREKIAVRDGAPVLLSSEIESTDRQRNLLARDDWDQLSFQRSAEDSSPEGVVLAVARERSPSVANHAVFGKERWSGPEDASIRVEATSVGDGTISVSFSATDDVAVLVADNARERAFLAADHWELWWTEEDPGCVPKANRICGVRQLGIGRTENGRLDVRWLYPFGYRVPVPRVSADSEAIIVVLPASVVSSPTASGAKGRFTVAYSDSDSAAGEQETIIATSRLKWGRPETFGTLVSWPGGRRFPPPTTGRLISDCWRVGEGERIR
jgi:hypothetical protein